MRGIESRIAARRPDVAPPSASARSAARARLREAIAAEPSGAKAAAPTASGRRPRMSAWLVPALAVTIAMVVAIIALVVPGDRRSVGTGRTGQPAASDRILALGGGALPQDGSGLTTALRVEYRRQLAAGDTLRTSIDAGLQRAADSSLRHAEREFGGARGTVVAMDPNTGAVAAMTSVHGAIGAGRQVGSVFDPFTALVAIQDGVWSSKETYDDTGTLCITAHAPCRHDAGRVAAGVINVGTALSSEDQLFFEHLGLLIRGDARPRKGSLFPDRRFGFAHATGIDLPGESAGVLSGVTDPADAANQAVGIGAQAITPIQLAVAYSALANAGRFQGDGAVVVPRVAEGLVDHAGHDHPPRAANFRTVSLRGEALAVVRAGLRANATASDGVGATAATFDSLPYAVHGVAGTVVSLSGGRQSDEAWYAGFVPAHGDRDALVVVVAIPHAGFGAVAAAPVARQVFNAWETGRAGPWRPGDSRVK